MYMYIQYKPSSHHKGPYDFDHVRLKQDLTGPHLVSRGLRLTHEFVSTCISNCCSKLLVSVTDCRGQCG